MVDIEITIEAYKKANELLRLELENARLKEEKAKLARSEAEKGIK